MNNPSYFQFLDAAEKIVKKGSEVKKIDGIPSGGSVCQDSVFSNVEAAAARLKCAIKQSMENLDEELTRFEKNFSNNRNAIFWANDYDDLFEGLRSIFKQQKVKSARLPNVNASTVFREVGMKYFLGEERIELKEDGDVQFFNVDMLLSDTGCILLVNQSNNLFGKLTNNKTNIFLATIDHVCNNSALVEVYNQLSQQNGGDQDYILFRGSTNCNNYLFILDNGRTNLLKMKGGCDALTCIGCGRCNEVCPVFQTIGEEPYNNVFSGPIANVVLPFLETVDTYKHVAYACTLCGACEEVCPLKIPIRDMIIENRHQFLSKGLLDKDDNHRIALQHKILNNRKKMNGSSFYRRQLINKIIGDGLKLSAIGISKEPFAKLIQKK